MNSRTFNKTVYILIILSIATIIAESYGDFYKRNELIIRQIDTAIYLAFTLEYLIRVSWSIKEKKLSKYLFSFFGIIDFLAILPFFLPFFIPLDSRSLRTSRLIRIVNIVKIGLYSPRKIETMISIIFDFWGKSTRVIPREEERMANYSTF